VPSNRQFYKTICMVVVLSEEPIQTTDLAEIARQGLIGDYSVAVSDSEITVLDGVAAARELRAQHSDPAFFGLDDAGEDLDAEPHLARPDRHTDGGPNAPTGHDHHPGCV